MLVQHKQHVSAFDVKDNSKEKISFFLKLRQVSEICLATSMSSLTFFELLLRRKNYLQISM